MRLSYKDQPYRCDDEVFADECDWHADPEPSGFFIEHGVIVAVVGAAFVVAALGIGAFLR